MRSGWSVQVRTFFLGYAAKGGAKGRRSGPSCRRHRATFGQRGGGKRMAVAEESWTKKYLGEVLGVFVLVFLGDSFVAYAVAGDGNGFLAGLLGAGFFLGFAGTPAIYRCGAGSRAHPNPPRTRGLRRRREFPRRD